MTKLDVTYDFSRGHPNESLLPVQEMQKAFAILSTQSISNNVKNTDQDDTENELRKSLNYGNESGSNCFKTEIASFLERNTLYDQKSSFDSTQDLSHVRNSNYPNKNDLFITNGASHGIELICSLLSKPGDVVYVERPTYFLVADIFRNHGLILEPLPMLINEHTLKGETKSDENDCKITDNRIDFDELERQLENNQKRAKFIYVIPTYQNPTSQTLPLEDRERLAKLSTNFGIHVIADEVYHLLDWRDKNESVARPARMCAFNNLHKDCRNDDNRGCCISVSSFTKIFAPGVRVGWIEAPQHIIHLLESYGYIQSGGGVAPFIGNLIMHYLLKHHIVDAVLMRLRKAYERRCNLVCDILQSDNLIDFQRPLGGYFIWIKFPDTIDLNEFLQFCLERKVKFRLGVDCDPFMSRNNGQSSTLSCARLCFADLQEEELEKGTKELLLAFKDYFNAK